MSEASAQPQGILAILTASDGEVVASAADFCRSEFGGVTDREVQEMRAKRALADAVVRNACASYIAKALSDQACENVVQHMCRQQGFRRTLVPVGYREDS